MRIFVLTTIFLLFPVLTGWAIPVYNGDTLTDDDWPMFGGNIHHTGVGKDLPNFKSMQLCGQRSLGGGWIKSQPIAVAGRLYANTEGGYTYSLNIHDLSAPPYWVKNVGGGVFTSPLYYKGNVYILDRNSQLSAFDIDGNLLWTYTGTASYYANQNSPIAANGVIYFGDMMGIVYAINTDGTLRWGRALYDRVHTEAVYDVERERIYIGASSGKIYVLDAGDNPATWGKVVGMDDIGGDMLYGGLSFYKGATSADDKVISGGEDGHVHSFRAEPFAFLDSYATGGTITAAPAIKDGRVYVASNSHRVYGLDLLADGSFADVCYSLSNNNYPKQSPCIIVACEIIASGCHGDRVIMRCTDCETVWYEDTTADTWGGLISHEGKIAVTGKNVIFTYCPVLDIPTLTASMTSTVTPSVTPTASPTATISASITASVTPSMTPSATPTFTSTVTSTATVTITATATVTVTGTWTETGTVTKTSTDTLVFTPTNTLTVTGTNTFTLTCTDSVTLTDTPTASPSHTSVATFTDTPTASSSHTPSATRTVTPTATLTGTMTPSSTATFTITCEVEPPQLSVKVVFDPERSDDLMLIMKSSEPVDCSQSYFEAYPHSYPRDKRECREVTQVDETTCQCYLPREVGFGDLAKVYAYAVDHCGNQGVSDGEFELEVIPDSGVVITSNKIRPGSCAGIIYQLEDATRVEIKIYNLAGELIKVIQNGNQPAGRYQEEWCGGNQANEFVASGIYVVYIRTDFYEVTEKIVVLK